MWEKPELNTNSRSLRLVHLPINSFAFIRQLLFGAILSALLVGCQTPVNIQDLQQQNAKLQTEIDTANRQISDLQNTERSLNEEITELNRVAGVLNTEKTSRVKESSSLRGSVRTFVQTQIDQLKHFLLASNLLDYVGGELIQRKLIDKKPIMLVDLANPIPKDGIVTGLGAHFNKPSTITIKVLRPVEDNLVVIWESKAMSITETGMRRVSFASNVGVKKGDIMGYYLSSPGISFDTGTGDTRYLKDELQPGAVVALSALSGEEKRRAYSIGVFGLLN